MRKLFKIFCFLLPFSILAQTNNDCYKLRLDASGNEDTSGVWLLKQNACKLRNTLPASEQTKFQVQDIGFCMTTEFLKSNSGNPFAEQFEEVKKISSKEYQYYVLIGRQTDNKGIYSKFFIEINLPNITPNNCPDNFNTIAKNFLINKIEEEYNARGQNYYNANISISTGLGTLADYIQDIKQCCQIEPNSIEKCLNCKSLDNMKTFLKSEGFVSNSIQNIGNYPSSSTPNIPEVLDFAKKLFTINDLSVVDIPNSYKETIDTFKAKGLTLKVIITQDNNFCTPLWDSLVSIANSGQYDIVYWHHIHKGESIGNDLLFTKTFFKSGTGNKGEGERAVFLPLIPILKGLGSAATDVFVQALFIYFTDDNVKSFSDAFGKVNYWQSGWSGVVGAFGINKNVALVGSALASATGVVVYNAYNKQGYGIEEGGKDFIHNFFVSLIFQKAVGYASSLTGGFGAIKITEIGAKGFKKLSSTVFWNSSAKPLKQEIELLWRLSKDKIVTSSSRGTLLQDWMHSLIYKSKGFINTDQWNVNFKGIDLYNNSQKFGISLKSLENSSIGNNIKENIDILSKGLKDKYITYGSNTANIDKVKLIIMVPKGNIKTVEGKLIEILKAKGVYDNPKFEYEVNSVESLLGLTL